MFDFVHALRVRVYTSPAFDGSASSRRSSSSRPCSGRWTAADRPLPVGAQNVVPILKVDLGLADENDGVQLMKPIGNLDDSLDQAIKHGIFGTKMRSVVKDASETGIAAIVEQQFAYADRIRTAGGAHPRAGGQHRQPAQGAGRVAAAGRHPRARGALPADALIMVKLTIPTQPGLYADLASDPRVLRVLGAVRRLQPRRGLRLLVTIAP